MKFPHQRGPHRLHPLFLRPRTCDAASSQVTGDRCGTSWEVVGKTAGKTRDLGTRNDDDFVDSGRIVVLLGKKNIQERSWILKYFHRKIYMVYVGNRKAGKRWFSQDHGFILVEWHIEMSLIYLPAKPWDCKKKVICLQKTWLPYTEDDDVPVR